MKKISLFLLCFFSLLPGYSQIGVSYHQSNLPFIGINYTIEDHIITEARVSTDVYTDNVSLEPTAVYIFHTNESVDAYGGLGVRFDNFQGLVVVPLGINIYPFENKSFGFHIEAAMLLGDHSILRGSWGARFRFN